MKHPTPKSLKKLQNKWPCDMCGKLYASKNIMQTHKATVHSNMRPFPCQFCEKAFKTKGQKGTHEQLHLAKLHSVCKFYLIFIIICTCKCYNDFL